MQISLMNGSQDNFQPKSIQSIEELAETITKQNYSLGVFNENKRTNKNFVKADFIGLDFDNGLSLSDAINRFNDFECIIAPTRNHQKEKNGIVADRFRVILKLETPITSPEDFKATALKLLEQNPEADRACSDAARQFFPSTTPRLINKKGRPVQVVKYVKQESPKLEKVNSLSKGKLSKTTLEFIAMGSNGKEWNPLLFKCAVDAMEQGYNYNETLELLYPATRLHDGMFDDNDIKTIKSAFNRDAKHPPRNANNCFHFKRTDELQENLGGQDWLVDEFLTKGGISVLAGSAKSGKSTLSRQLTRSILNGTDFLGRSTKKGKVLYLALEESESMLKVQLTKLGIKPEDDLLLHVGPVAAGNIEDSLTEAINAFGADLVIVDTLLLLAQFQNINDYNETYTKIAKYCNIARQTGAHILCLHHVNKGQDRGANSILGSSAIMAAVDCFVIFGTIPGRQGFRTFTSQQRGGKMFVNQQLKYIPEMDIYELAESNSGDW